MSTGDTSRKPPGKGPPGPGKPPSSDQHTPVRVPGTARPAGQTSIRLPKPSATGKVPRAEAEEPKSDRLKPVPPQTTRVRREKSSNESPPEPTRIRRGAAPRGMSLRGKITLSMVGVVLLSAVLILVVVYTKSSTILNDEINSRGERLVEVLASIDPEYWLAAIHGPDRDQEFRELVQAIGPVPDWSSKLASEANARRHQLLVDPFAVAREREAEALLTELSADPGWKAKVEKDAALKEKYERLARPLRSFNQLKPLSDMKGNPDVAQIGVFDVSRNETRPLGILGGVVTEFPMDPYKPGERLTIIPRRSIDTGSGPIPGRVFFRNPDPSDTVKLRYMVSLSTRGIDEAKNSLTFFILVPILLSAVVAIVIALVMSQRITEPVKLLIDDINRVSAGRLDHETVAHSKDEIGVLADTFNRMTGALRAAREQELEAKAMEHELGIAAEIQANLVPKRMLKLPGYDISAYYRPSKEVGGDYYDFISIDEHHSGIIVADVSGKGVPGSLVMSMTRAFIRMEAERSKNLSTASTMTYANRMLAQDIKKGMFVTAIYVVLDHRTNEVCVSSAGHNPLYLIKSTGELKLVNPKGIALGFDKGPVFERTITEEKFILEKGDRIVMYTDGAVEAMNARNEEFGDEKFEKLCRDMTGKESGQFLGLLVHALDAHKGDAPQHDDLTIVTFRYQ